jgi:hypothetical protein
MRATVSFQYGYAALLLNLMTARRHNMQHIRWQAAQLVCNIVLNRQQELTNISIISDCVSDLLAFKYNADT